MRIQEHFNCLKELEKEELLCWCERVETKNGKTLKVIKIDEFKNFLAVEKSLDRCIASNG